jgi:hypothetical protein
MSVGMMRSAANTCRPAAAARTRSVRRTPPAPGKSPQRLRAGLGQLVEQVVAVVERVPGALQAAGLLGDLGSAGGQGVVVVAGLLTHPVVGGDDGQRAVSSMSTNRASIWSQPRSSVAPR